MKNYQMTMSKKENISAYIFLLPWIIGMAVFYVYPFIHSLCISFTDANLVSASFVGLKNYIQMLDDSRFIKSVMVTMRYAFISVPLKLMFALFLAMILKKGSTFFRTAYYIPSLIGSSVAVAVMWKQLFGMHGIINKSIGVLGFEGKNWLGEPDFALNVLIILAIWQFGSSMVIFIAGLKNIPNQLYEAATIDGAKKRSQFWHITLPMLSPVIQFNLVLQLITAFQVFTQGYVITKGGPMDETLFTVQYIYEQAFKATRLGYSTAMSWGLFTIIAIVTAVIFLTSKYWVYHEND